MPGRKQCTRACMQFAGALSPTWRVHALLHRGLLRYCTHLPGILFHGLCGPDVPRHTICLLAKSPVPRSRPLLHALQPQFFLPPIVSRFLLQSGCSHIRICTYTRVAMTNFSFRSISSFYRFIAKTICIYVARSLYRRRASCSTCTNRHLTQTRSRWS